MSTSGGLGMQEISQVDGRSTLWGRGGLKTGEEMRSLPPSGRHFWQDWQSLAGDISPSGEFDVDKSQGKPLEKQTDTFAAVLSPEIPNQRFSSLGSCGDDKGNYTLASEMPANLPVSIPLVAHRSGGTATAAMPELPFNMKRPTRSGRGDSKPEIDQFKTAKVKEVEVAPLQETTPSVAAAASVPIPSQAPCRNAVRGSSGNQKHDASPTSETGDGSSGIPRVSHVGARTVISSNQKAIAADSAWSGDPDVASGNASARPSDQGLAGVTADSDHLALVGNSDSLSERRANLPQYAHREAPEAVATPLSAISRKEETDQKQPHGPARGGDSAIRAQKSRPQYDQGEVAHVPRQTTRLAEPGRQDSVPLLPPHQVAGTHDVRESHIPSTMHVIDLTRAGERDAIVTRGQTLIREPFAAMDMGSIEAPSRWVHASRNRAEAGFEDPTLGWVGVRAEAGAHGVHAALIPGSLEAARALELYLASLNTHMAAQHPHLNPITISPPDAPWDNPASGREMTKHGQQEMDSRQQHGREDQEQAAPLRPGSSQVTRRLSHAQPALNQETTQRIDASGGIHVSVIA